MAKVGRFLDRLIAYLGYLGAAAGAASIVIMVIIVTVNVFLRQVFNKPLLFTEEYCGYLLVLAVYMGLAYTTRVGAHIKVELITSKLPKRAKDGLEVITLLPALVLIGIMFWYGWDLFMVNLRGGYRASTFYATPLWIPFIPMWVGLIFFGLAVVALMVRKCVDFQKSSKKELS